MSKVKHKRRPRGSIYARPDSPYLWIAYSCGGRKTRENSKLTSERKARKLLDQRLGELTLHGFTSADTGKTTVEEIMAVVLADYKINARKSLDDAEGRWNLHLKPFFGILRAQAVTSEVVMRYVSARKAARASNGSINRELALLRRAFNLAMQATPPKVMRAPRFPRLKENPPRTGFLTDENFARLAAACAKEGLWLRAMLEVARSYGWRIAELQNLHVKQVDLFARTIRLEPGSTKNEDGREVAMTDAIFTLLTECVQGKSGDDYVFTRRNGKRIADFRGTWHKVCCATRLGMMHCMSCGQPVAGNHCETCRLPWRQNQLRYRGLLWHDLRRTAVRNLVRSGISEKIAMTVTGHRTRSVFDRYAIIAASDLREAALKMQARDAAVAERLRNVTDLSHVSVTVAPLPAAAVVN